MYIEKDLLKSSAVNYSRYLKLNDIIVQTKISISNICNPGHNIFRHFNVWQNFRITTSETNRDY